MLVTKQQNDERPTHKTDSSKMIKLKKQQCTENTRTVNNH